MCTYKSAGLTTASRISTADYGADIGCGFCHVLIGLVKLSAVISKYCTMVWVTSQRSTSLRQLGTSSLSITGGMVHSAYRYFLSPARDERK